ncbi:autotransporter adhesin Ag43, partial [Escherichia coli]|nr:autotransporter adhesin Ag43 [Escherichia coli]EER5359741.1 autotransporter adhesin Ag43 [Escherichia coli]EEY8595538.1 autotransporter adhesin Ag43 [Escherichia coli]EFG9741760.1 autotransporter adhesin Ag43 [Escherichia coli]EGC4586070.1 autotransporter adhesin Ag43 [Escherichia coli]
MKRHLNTSYRLVWNHITGTLVVASELARSRGKRAGVAVALSLAAVTSVPALAADKVVQAGETVNDGTLTNHDNQIVFGTANGMTISTGLELGPDSEENTGGQWIQNGGIAGNTTVTTNGRQVVLEGGTASDTVIRDGGGQSLNGLAVNTTLNNRGEQWVHEGGVATGTIINRDGYQSVKSGGLATGTIINTGAEGGPDSDNSYTGQKVQGTAESTTINKNGRQIILFSGLARDTLIYAGGDQSVHGRALNTTLNGGYQYVHRDGLALNTVINEGGWQVVKAGGAAGNTTINQNGELRVHAGGEATAVTQNTGGALVTSTAATVIGTNRLGNFTVENGKADGVVLESGGRLDVLESHSAQNTLVDDGGTLAVSAGGKATSVTITSGGALIADSGATVEGTNASGKFSIDGTSGQASGLLLENGGSFTVNAGGQAGNTTVGHRGTLTLAAGGSLSGRTQLSKGASMVLNGDVVSTGDIVNAGEIRFDNQTTPNAALSRAVAKSNSPVTFHKLTTTNLTGQGGTINMRVRLDGSNASDQLVINGGQATGKTWLAFTNVGNSNLGVATTGQGIRVVDAQNGATTEEGAFALSRPLQAGAFNYTLNRDSDEDWYLRSENAYRAEVPLYTSMLTQAMDYDRILAGSRSHQTGVNGENNSVRLSIQGGHLGHDNNGGIARGATPESSGSYGFVRLEGDLLRTEVAGMSLTTGVYGAAGHSSVDVK